MKVKAPAVHQFYFSLECGRQYHKVTVYLLSILGYSIFVVFGTMPDCQAHEMLLIQPAVQVSKPERIQLGSTKGYRLGSASEDPDLQRAIRLSMGQVITFRF